MDYTVVLVKPDGVKRGIIGEILMRFERVGLKIAAAKLIWVDEVKAGKHYRDDEEYHKSVGEKTFENYKKYGLDLKEKLGVKNEIKMGKLVRKWNMDYLAEGPLFAMLLTGPRAIELERKLVGFTFPFDAVPGTIRGDYGLESVQTANLEARSTKNLIHASGSKEEAEFERKLWFKESEIYDY